MSKALYDKEMRLKIALEALQERGNIDKVCRKYGLSRSTADRYICEYKYESGIDIEKANNPVNQDSKLFKDATEVIEAANRIRRGGKRVWKNGKPRYVEGGK